MQSKLTDRLLKNLIINENQGYAFYWEDHNTKITAYQGLRDINIPSSFIDQYTNFRLASVTKQFIAYGILMLVKNYGVSLDTKVSDIFNDLPSYFQKIQIKHLLNHTSGILDYEDIPHDTTDKQIHDEDILTFLKKTTHPYFTAGTNYRYSNTAFILLGLIIEKVSQMKIDIYLEKYVFSKAKMNDTYVNYEGQTNINKRAYGHLINHNNLIKKDQYWCSATIGYGGIYSNIDDLNKWIDFLLSQYDDLKETMFQTTILDNGEDICYGYGIKVIKVLDYLIFYHCGDTIGTNTFILFSPKLNLRCLFLTNIGNVDTEILKNNIVEYLKLNLTK